MQKNNQTHNRHAKIPLNNCATFDQAKGLWVVLRGVRKKSGPGVKSSNFSANIGPTETYYIPNQWKLNKAFAELCRFEIAALIE